MFSIIYTINSKLVMNAGGEAYVALKTEIRASIKKEFPLAYIWVYEDRLLSDDYQVGVTCSSMSRAEQAKVVNCVASIGKNT